MVYLFPVRVLMVTNGSSVESDVPRPNSSSSSSRKSLRFATENNRPWELNLDATFSTLNQGRQVCTLWLHNKHIHALIYKGLTCFSSSWSLWDCEDNPSHSRPSVNPASSVNPYSLWSGEDRVPNYRAKAMISACAVCDVTVCVVSVWAHMLSLMKRRRPVMDRGPAWWTTLSSNLLLSLGGRNRSTDLQAKGLQILILVFHPEHPATIKMSGS